MRPIETSGLRVFAWIGRVNWGTLPIHLFICLSTCLTLLYLSILTCCLPQKVNHTHKDTHTRLWGNHCTNTSDVCTPWESWCSERDNVCVVPFFFYFTWSLSALLHWHGTCGHCLLVSVCVCINVHIDLTVYNEFIRYVFRLPSTPLTHTHTPQHCIFLPFIPCVALRCTLEYFLSSRQYWNFFICCSFCGLSKWCV